jgi:biopolymer transport protein ExbB
MVEIVRAGGWLMLPIIGCSIIVAGIVWERLWTLQPKRVLPVNLAKQVRDWVSKDQLGPEHLQRLHQSSPLGQMLAAGLANRDQPREVIKESVEDAGRHAVHELERYLSPLGTIAAISPLMGLLGTVIGMIKVFAAITASGVGNPGVLAGGISEALITTAAGLSVAIPALICYRYLRTRVDGLVIRMEKETIKFLETVVAYQQHATELNALKTNEITEPVKRRA